MSYKKVFWGVILILIGVLIILKNVGAIYFSWWSILRLWPILLVLWGISIIPVRDWIKLLTSLVVVALSIVLIVNYNRWHHTEFRWFGPPFHHWRWDRDDWEKQQRKVKPEEERVYSQKLVEPYDSTVLFSELRLDAAAGEFRLGDTTADLIHFEREGYWGDYSMTSQDTDDKRIISLTLRDDRIGLVKDGHKVVIRLHPEPVWDFNFDIGAAGVDMDMSAYKTRMIDIDGGAASIRLKIGDDYPETTLNIDAGASSITIDIPETSGCELSANTVLSSRNLEGFIKVRDHMYQTGNFDTAANKIYLSIDAAVSGLTIKRY